MSTTMSRVNIPFPVVLWAIIIPYVMRSLRWLLTQPDYGRSSIWDAFGKGSISWRELDATDSIPVLVLALALALAVINIDFGAGRKIGVLNATATYTRVKIPHEV